MAEFDPPADRRDLHHPTEDVREQQEQQGGRLVAALGVEQRLPALGDRVRLEHEVRVGEDTALGAAGRSGRVDDRRRRLGRDRPPVPVHHLVVDVAAGLVQLLHRARVQLPQLVQCREPVDDRGDGHRVVLVLHHRGRHLRVVQHPEDLLGRRGGVDGHDLRADRPQREVEEGPLVARTGHDRDPVAEPDAVRQQTLGERQDLVPELGGRHIAPLALVVLAAECDVERILLGMFEHGIGQAAHRRCRRQGRVGELAQSPLLVVLHSAVKATPPCSSAGGRRIRVRAGVRTGQQLKYGHNGAGRDRILTLP